MDPAARVVAPAALALFVVVGALLSDRDAGQVVGVAGGVIGLALLLAWRRAVGGVLAAGLVVAAVGVAFLGHEDSANVGWFAVCAAAGWLALVLRRGPAVLAIAAVVALLVFEWVNESDEPGWAAWISGTVFTAASCAAARRQEALLAQLREAQAGLADRARAEERNRIAAEMHDVIGHALTVSLLHISSARLSVDEDPEEARASLAEAERLAQQSLAEVRAAVGLMRSAEDAAAPPLPGVADVPELVESFRRAGTPVALDVDGDVTAVPATRGLAIYRIVQESLTNVARHAPGEAAEVRIAVDGGATTVTVTSGGAPVASPREGAGVLGMRERAEALGGKLLAGPWQSGWRVEAVLPS